VDTRNIKISDKGCWIWQRAKAGNGYGTIGISGKMHYVHRLMQQIFNGGIMPGSIVMHSCDNPSCVNPAHLSNGTMKSNSRDMTAKGRGFVPPSPEGEDHHSFKFNEKAIQEIFKDIRAGLKCEEVCRKNNINKTTVYRIIKKRGLTWKTI